MQGFVPLLLYLYNHLHNIPFFDLDKNGRFDQHDLFKDSLPFPERNVLSCPCCFVQPGLFPLSSGLNEGTVVRLAHQRGISSVYGSVTTP